MNQQRTPEGQRPQIRYEAPEKASCLGQAHPREPRGGAPEAGASDQESLVGPEARSRKKRTDRQLGPPPTSAPRLAWGGRSHAYQTRLGTDSDGCMKPTANVTQRPLEN